MPVKCPVSPDDGTATLLASAKVAAGNERKVKQ